MPAAFVIGLWLMGVSWKVAVVIRDVGKLQILNGALWVDDEAGPGSPASADAASVAWPCLCW